MTSKELLAQIAQKYGFSSSHIASITGSAPQQSLTQFRMVDTCAGEFSAYTPYFYSVAIPASQSPMRGNKKKVIILGSGPIRIGQGIEFDYATVHAVQTVQENGYEAIIINNNPETVSTDFDISDRLYFEPLALTEVLSIIEHERENLIGIIPQFGGQTAINLAGKLANAGLPLLGSSHRVIEQCENRKFTSSKLAELFIPVTPWTVAATINEAIVQCRDIGYPVLIRPSFVLGGRGMKIIYNEASLALYLKEAVQVTPELPVYIDKFLQDAKEIDVDAVCDGKDIFHVVMEQIEHAGVHSGDSACVIPTQTLSQQVLNTIKLYTERIALAFGVVGLMNIQYAVKHDDVYVLEINPRASRTIPFASKAINLPLAKIGTSVLLGKTLADTIKHYREERLGSSNIDATSVCIKEVVLSFRKLQLDPLLSPEMQSTGEVIGIGTTFGEAFFKSQSASGNPLSLKGRMFLSLSDSAKDAIPALAIRLKQIPYTLYATEGTAKSLNRVGVSAKVVQKISVGSPHILDVFNDNTIDLLVNIPESRAEDQHDALLMRQYVVDHQVPFISSLPALKAALDSILSHQDF